MSTIDKFRKAYEDYKPKPQDELEINVPGVGTLVVGSCVVTNQKTGEMFRLSVDGEGLLNVAYE